LPGLPSTVGYLGISDLPPSALASRITSKTHAADA
jgi:hypothetical protein